MATIIQPLKKVDGIMFSSTIQKFSNPKLKRHHIAFKKKILVFSKENVALKGQNVYLSIYS